MHPRLCRNATGCLILDKNGIIPIKSPLGIVYRMIGAGLKGPSKACSCRSVLLQHYEELFRNGSVFITSLIIDAEQKIRWSAFSKTPRSDIRSEKGRFSFSFSAFAPHLCRVTARSSDVSELLAVRVRAASLLTCWAALLLVLQVTTSLRSYWNDGRFLSR